MVEEHNEAEALLEQVEKQLREWRGPDGLSILEKEDGGATICGREDRCTEIPPGEIDLETFAQVLLDVGLLSPLSGEPGADEAPEGSTQDVPAASPTAPPSTEPQETLSAPAP